MVGWEGQPVATYTRAGCLHCLAMHAALPTSLTAEQCPRHCGEASELVWVADRGCT